MGGGDKIMYKKKWYKIIDEIIFVLRYSIELNGMMNVEFEQLLNEKEKLLKENVKIN